MQYTDNNQGEAELISLLLKRQQELNALLELTRAVNKNAATPVLIQMLEAILKNQLRVGRMRLLLEKDESFICISKFGGHFETLPPLLRACKSLKKLREPTAIDYPQHSVLKNYGYYIPIYSKNKPLAYILVGEFENHGDILENDIQFIQTLVNAIVVALQSKKLFRERLQNERFQREMELAVEVQNMLIPGKLHKDAAVEISSKYLPHQDIGGDYFDFIRLNDHEIVWCIADVSGKGISAALLMANFQASLRAWATVEGDLTAIVDRLNHIVIGNTRGEKFITLFLAKYNEQTRRLNYINCGHNPSILYSNGSAMPLNLGTTMIGAFEELPFLNEGEIDLEPGSLIFNYTDGLMDYEVEQYSDWNEERLLDFVVTNGGQSPERFNQLLLDHLNLVIKGKRIDDITMLTLRIF